ncbi:peptidase A8 [Bacteroidia bacterium]|nr:peptidase A8 [Bacteroidia bacterium]
MKIRTIVLWVTVLVVIEQFIKLIISKYYQDINFEIIPSLFEFKPTLNNKSFYWLGLMGIDVGRWARLITGTVALVILYLFYRYMKTVLKKNKLIDVACVFAFAGIICSLCDNVFFGGSWDYIYLKPLFVFDLKDVYLNCFAILFLISYVKNKKYLNSKFLWGK